MGQKDTATSLLMEAVAMMMVMTTCMRRTLVMRACQVDTDIRPFRALQTDWPALNTRVCVVHPCTHSTHTTYLHTSIPPYHHTFGANAKACMQYVAVVSVRQLCSDSSVQKTCVQAGMHTLVDPGQSVYGCICTQQCVFYMHMKH